MSDVTVAAALVQSGEDPLYLRSATGRCGQPRPVTPARIDVGRRILRADIRQPGSSQIEPPDGLGRRIRFLRISRVGTLPARNGPLLQVGGVLGPAARLDAGPGGSPVTGSLRDVLPRPVRTIRLIRVAPELGHAVSIAARATAWLAPMPGQVP